MGCRQPISPTRNTATHTRTPFSSFGHWLIQEDPPPPPSPLLLLLLLLLLRVCRRRCCRAAKISFEFQWIMWVQVSPVFIHGLHSCVRLYSCAYTHETSRSRASSPLLSLPIFSPSRGIPRPPSFTSSFPLTSAWQNKNFPVRYFNLPSLPNLFLFPSRKLTRG